MPNSRLNSKMASYTAKYRYFIQRGINSHDDDVDIVFVCVFASLSLKRRKRRKSNVCIHDPIHKGGSPHITCVIGNYFWKASGRRKNEIPL